MKERNNIPTLRGYLVSNGTTEEGELRYILNVYCPYCNKFHKHGVLNHEFFKKDNHRVAHCSQGPLVETGYYIKAWTTEQLQDILKDCRFNF